MKYLILTICLLFSTFFVSTLSQNELERYILTMGSNDLKQLGIPTSDGENTPTKIQSDTLFTRVYAHQKMSFAVSENDGFLYSWGDNRENAVLRSNDEQIDSPQRVEDLPLNVTTFGIGGSESNPFWWAFGHNSNNQNERKLYSWGYDTEGQIGNRGNNALSAPTEQYKEGFANINRVGAGELHSVLLQSNQKIQGTGDNSKGQLAISTERRRSLIMIYNDNVTDIAVGNHHTLVLFKNGTLYSTGDNSYGQLGLGDSVEQIAEFTQVSLAESIVQCFAGPYSSFAVTETGKLYAWGKNEHGELGIGSNSPIVQNPTRVNGLPQSVESKSIIFRIVSHEHTVVLLEDGRVFVFGRNDNGQLGISGSSSSTINSPQELKLDEPVLDAAVGSEHTILLCGKRSCIDDCNQNGNCQFMTGVCECYENIFGDFCEFKKCLDDCNSNLDRGTCDYDTGICECNEPFQGESCSYQRCPGDCNGNGACDISTGECHCFDGFTGNNCRGSGAASNVVSILAVLISIISLVIFSL